MDESARPGRPPSDVAAVLRLGQGHNARRWRRLAIAGALAAVGLGAVFVWYSGGTGNSVRYVAEPAARGPLTVVVTATGSVQPTNKVDVSSELSGIIRRVNVDYNSVVKVGDVLAELDTDKLRATVDSSRAKLAAARAKVLDAEAGLVQTRLQYDRKKTLVERQVGSEYDFEVARAAYDKAVATLASAKADVTAAEADLKLNETNLAKACICSPINGVVLARNVDPGQTVATSFQAPVLFVLAEDLKQMEIQVDIDEADVGKVREGQKAVFTVDAYPERKFQAELRELRFGSEVVQGVVTYKGVLTADNSELLLRPGMTATAEVTVQHIGDALLVPNAALRFSPPDATETGTARRGLLKQLVPSPPRFRRPSPREDTGRDRQVWILRDGAAVAVPVKVGPTDGRRTQILDGAIEPGQPVIVDASVPEK